MYFLEDVAKVKNANRRGWHAECQKLKIPIFFKIVFHFCFYQVVLIRLFTADEAHSSVPVNLSFTCQRWFDQNKNDGVTVYRFAPDQFFQPESTKQFKTRPVILQETISSADSVPTETFYSADILPGVKIFYNFISFAFFNKKYPPPV